MNCTNIDQNQYEQKITALHGAAQEIFQADTKQAVAEIIVEAVRDILGMPINCVLVHDQADNVLRTMARTQQSYELLDEDPVFHPGESLAWAAFETGEPRFYDDVSSVPGRANPDTPIRSEIIIPLGDHGVLLIGSTKNGTFTDVDRSLAETLGKHAQAAFDRLAHEHELKRQNARLEEFASIVSHDLRNPLNVAQGRIELAREEHDNKHLESAATALDRSLALIDDILAYAREGQTTIQPEPVNLQKIIKGCWNTVDTADATLVTHVDNEIIADAGRFKQLVENLLRNAIEHGGEDVTITVGELDHGFYIEDTGQGIPASEQDAVFEPGYSTGGEGTGFGLSIVNQIVKAHNWNIRCTEGTDGGARFEITGVSVPTLPTKNRE